ncbi:T9SS type A sorting domain-containing protein, partial [Flavobacterium laiguense]
ISSTTSGNNTISYQLYNSSNTPVQGAKTGTGSGLTWNGLAAGNGYYVIATGATPTSCTSTSVPANVTTVANPAAPLVTYDAPCDKITFSITISGANNGSTYTIKDKSGNDISSLTKNNVALNPVSSYTATAQDASNGTITIDGFPAGSGYRVSVSTDGCGSGETNCGVPPPPPSPARMTEQNTSKEKLIDTATEKVGFVVFPVPFKDQLTVRYNFDYASQVLIEVFNSRGNKILSKKDANGYLNKEISLNLTSTGQSEVYFVKVTTDRGSSVQKVISSR